MRSGNFKEITLASIGTRMCKNDGTIYEPCFALHYISESILTQAKEIDDLAVIMHVCVSVA